MGRFYRVPFKSLLRVQIKRANDSKIFIEEILIKEISNVEGEDQKVPMGKVAVENAFKKINPRYCPNVPTTPITAMGCRQCLLLSVVQLKGKPCQKPHCCNGVVDSFRHNLIEKLLDEIGSLKSVEYFTRHLWLEFVLPPSCGEKRWPD